MSCAKDIATGNVKQPTASQSLNTSSYELVADVHNMCQLLKFSKPNEKKSHLKSEESVQNETGQSKSTKIDDSSALEIPKETVSSSPVNEIQSSVSKTEESKSEVNISKEDEIKQRDELKVFSFK